MKTVYEIRNYIDDMHGEIPYNDYSQLIDMVDSLDNELDRMINEIETAKEELVDNSKQHCIIVAHNATMVREGIDMALRIIKKYI